MKRWTSLLQQIRRRQVRRVPKHLVFETLEDRRVLNGIPLATDDVKLSTAINTALSVSGANALLANDWDPEGSPLTASVISGPANGSLSSFNDSTGSFIYTPDLGFSGVDSFTYVVNDGTDDSNIATVSIAVGGHFGPRTNAEEATRASLYLEGANVLSQPLTPGLGLVYNSNTLPKPIVVLETFLQSSSSVPDEIKATLTFNGVAGTTYSYSTTGLSAGDTLRFALQADATSLATGRYAYTVRLTARFGGVNVDHDYSGYADVVNRGDSAHPFGRGWQLAGLDELVAGSGGMMLVASDGSTRWFAEDGLGGYLYADGDESFSTLVENIDGSFTLTDKHQNETNFDSSGKLTSRVDPNDNTVTFTWSGGQLVEISDPFGRDTTLSYTSGRLSSVTDFASRTATLSYDGSGRLDDITQPDPDGGGALAAPSTSFDYNATTHLLTKITDPLTYETSFTYGTHQRLTQITYPTSANQQFSSLQTNGLPTGTTGNSLSSANPTGSATDERAKQSTFRTDRFGNITEWTNPLGHKTLSTRTSVGLLAKLTEADPDGGGPLSSPVTIFGHDGLGNLVYRLSPRGYSRTWTYESSFNQVASETDELGNTTEYDYDTDGNLTTLTDALDNETTFTYDTGGRVASKTTPDPDGTGPQAAAVTEYTYDAYGRLETVTHPDETTVEYAYDTADNVTSITDELLNETTFVYDALNRLTSTTDRENATTSYEYNALGWKIKETDALGNETDYEYNSRGWLTKQTNPDPDGAGALTRPESTYIYDAAGNLTQIGSAGIWAGSIAHVYDDAGRRTSTTGPGASTVTHYVYDNLGRVTRMTDALDMDTDYTYDASGNLIQETIAEVALPALGPTSTYVYDALDRVIQETDPRGYVTNYSYNAIGLLSGLYEPDPDGTGPMSRPFTAYSYDGAGRLILTIDELNRITSYEYDSRGRLIEVTEPDPDGSGPLAAPVTAYAYDSGGRLTSVTDPLMQVISYGYDDEGRQTSITGPDPDGAGPLSAPQTTMTYNALGLMTSVTDPGGGVTTHTYDGLRRPTDITGPDPDGTGPLTAPQTIYVYNSHGELYEEIDPQGRSTIYGYDGLGHRTSVTDDAGNQTTYAYNELSQLVSITTPDPDGAGPQTASVTAYAYDIYHRLSKITDPINGDTHFTYDDAGNRLTLTDPAGNVTSWAYDGLGRVTMETNELNQTRSFYYDVAGRLTRRIDRNDRTRQFVYDDLDRTTAEQWYVDGTPAPSISIATTTDGGVTDEVQRVGFSGQIFGGTFTLTVAGQTTAALAYNASAATVLAALEALSSVEPGDVSVTKTQDTMMAQEWKLAFAGNLAGTDVAPSTIDSTSITGFMITDTEATVTEGGTANDEVQTVTLTDADGGIFRLAFQGQTTKPLDHDATAAEVETALEELAAVDDVTVTGSAGGPWTVAFGGTQSALDLPRLNGDAANLTGGTLTRTIDYAYDAASQLTSATDPDSSYAYTYDALGRVLTVDNDGTPGVPQVVLTSAYDARGNRTSLAVEIDSTDDFLNTYTFDALSRLTRVDQTGQAGGNTVAEKRVDFTYNALGQFTSMARYKDTAGGSAHEVATSEYVYDTLARLTDLAHQRGGTDLFTPYEWSYDNMNRITQFVSQDGTSDYEYDKTSQLTAADHSYMTDESYSYDANGNRTMTGYSTGDNNQLASDGTYNYTYDDEGNRLTRTNISTGAVTEYTWDHRNRLVAVTDKTSGGTVTRRVEYEYDVFDRRISRAVDTSSPFTMTDAAIERYVYDDVTGVASTDRGNVIFDFHDPDGSGSAPLELAKRYLYGQAVDQILAQENVAEGISDADRVYWPLVDHLGTVRDLAQQDGTIAEHYEYDSFGQVVAGDASLTRYLFTGREYDEDVNLQLSRARWYDANAGRWLSEDLLGFEGGDSHLARYVRNNPLNSRDASGLRESQVYMAAGDPANWDWIDYAANIAAGYGDGITGGATNWIRGALGINDGIDHGSTAYTWSNIAGTAHQTYLTGGSVRIATAPVWVQRTITGIRVADKVANVGQSTYNIATGQGSISDAGAFLPFVPSPVGKPSSVLRVAEAPRGLVKRQGAFRSAKRDAGIPGSKQPDSVTRVPMTDRNGKAIVGADGKPIITREYTFTRPDGSKVIIQDHSAGHNFGQGGVGDHGPHFNVRPIESPRHGTVPGTQPHYPFNR